MVVVFNLLALVYQPKTIYYKKSKEKKWNCLKINKSAQFKSCHTYAFTHV